MFVANVVIGIPAELTSDKGLKKPPQIPGTNVYYDSVKG